METLKDFTWRTKSKEVLRKKLIGMMGTADISERDLLVARTVQANASRVLTHVVVGLTMLLATIMAVAIWGFTLESMIQGAGHVEFERVPATSSDMLWSSVLVVAGVFVLAVIMIAEWMARLSIKNLGEAIMIARDQETTTA